MPDNMKCHHIQFRCTDQEYRKIESAKTQYGVSASEYLRMKTFDAPDRQYMDISTREAIRDLAFEINKVGTNLNQFVKICNAHGDVSRNDIEELKKYMNLIRTLENEFIKKAEGGKQNGSYEATQT